MLSIQNYVHQGRRLLRKWAVNPRIHSLAVGAAYGLAGFGLSAASLLQVPMPLALGLVCGCSGWSSLLAAMGACLGYRVFWGSACQQPMVWMLLGLGAAVLLADRGITRRTPLLLPAIAGLITAACGLLFQLTLQDQTPVPAYLLRVALAVGSTWLLQAVLRGRQPVLDWLAWGMAVLALAQIMPIPYVGLGYIVSGALAMTGAFPAAALAGLALDLAQVTPVPMTAVLALTFLLRLLPWYSRKWGMWAPAGIYLLVMGLVGRWDLQPLPGLLLGGFGGGLLPLPGQAVHRRGETGVAQVRLELASGVLTQTQQLLLEAEPVPVDEDALVCRAAERACSGCPCRRSCKDSVRLLQLPGVILHKPLLQTHELPIICRKSGRFLAELHRSQEQLRSIRADRERQREYRTAVIQQYRFLAEYLQNLSDQLSRRTDSLQPVYQPKVRICGNQPEADNGDRCLRFAGIQCKYYVLLCDGMGTGLGAVQEGRTAAGLLRRMLSAGYPAEHALQSLNSLCALRSRAGAVTVDLAELDLHSGRASLYKWGAAPSYLVSTTAVEKLGTMGPPPGLSVTDPCQRILRTGLRQREVLVLVSDGIAEDEALRCCMDHVGAGPEDLATGLLARAQAGGQDDATVIAVRLE